MTTKDAIDEKAPILISFKFEIRRVGPVIETNLSRNIFPNYY